MRRIRGLIGWIERLRIGVWQWTKSLPNSTAFWLALVGIVLIGSILGLVFGGWDWFRPPLSEGQSAVATESRSTTIRNVGFVIGGVVALVFAIWRGVVAHRQSVTAERQAETALRQSETAQQGLLNERYQKGAEMLGSEVLSVRLAGIYALQRLAEEHLEQYHIQIMQLFCAFVRNPVGEAEGPMYHYATMEEPIRRLREDVQAIISAIGNRSKAAIDIENATENFELNLRNADLRGVLLHEANLSGAFLADADLSDAELESLELYRINLNGANLSNASLGDTNLSGAMLGQADLSDAFVDGADLSGAYLANADLSNAEIMSTNLSRASLYGADLTGASFSVSMVTGGYGGQAKGLTQAQLDEARSDPENPPNLNSVLDAETGEQLVWHGKPLDDDP